MRACRSVDTMRNSTAQPAYCADSATPISMAAHGDFVPARITIHVAYSPNRPSLIYLHVLLLIRLVSPPSRTSFSPRYCRETVKPSSCACMTIFIPVGPTCTLHIVCRRCRKRRPCCDPAVAIISPSVRPPTHRLHRSVYPRSHPGVVLRSQIWNNANETSHSFSCFLLPLLGFAAQHPRASGRASRSLWPYGAIRRHRPAHRYLQWHKNTERASLRAGSIRSLSGCKPPDSWLPRCEVGLGGFVHD